MIVTVSVVVVVVTSIIAKGGHRVPCSVMVRSGCYGSTEVFTCGMAFVKVW